VDGFDLLRGVKWGLLALMVGAILSAMILLLLSGGDRLPQIEAPIAVTNQQANVDRPVIIERKAGKVVWRLKAKKAEQELGGSMHLVAPELELYSEDNMSIPVAARDAWFNPLTKSVNFKGGVVVRYGEWTLYAEDVSYKHASDILSIPGDFRIESKLTKARGKGLTAWRGERHVRVESSSWIEDRHPYKMQVEP